MSVTRFFVLVATILTTSVPAFAQGSVGASGRATTALTLTAAGQASGAEATRISIDYGQPHARGRTVNGALEGDLGQLIVNKKTGQWGIPYDASTELGRTPLTSRTLATPIESFTMWLIPAADGSGGEIRFTWGTREFSAPWRVK